MVKKKRKKPTVPIGDDEQLQIECIPKEKAPERKIEPLLTSNGKPRLKPIQRFDSIKDNETVRKYFRMECDICNYPFKTFLHAKHHHMKMHNHNGYIMCCEKKFFKLYRVMQHCMWHENPDSFRYIYCLDS